MGLRDEVTADIKAAFDTDLADAVTQFEGFREIKSEPNIDDWISNAASSAQSTIDYGGRGVFSSYSEIEVDGDSIKMNDVKLLLLQAECTRVPAIDDFINGYRVIAVQKDAADVTWVLQLRKV